MRIFIILFLIFFGQASYSGEVYTGFFDDLALQGYDATAYFTAGKAIKGSKDFSMKYKGATWRFANQAALNLFQSDPEKYFPAFGGHCSNGIAENTRVAGDPNLFLVNNDRLHVFYAKKGLETWQNALKNGSFNELLALAEKNWLILKE